MRVYRGLTPALDRAASAALGAISAADDASPAPAALAIGNFDGVHRGHRAVLARARAAAEARGLAAGAITFEPHPRSVFRADDPPFRLSKEPLKLRRLAAEALERTHVLPFTAALQGLAPRAFAELLAGPLAARAVVVGEDFRFGAQRAGDVAALRAFGAELGFDVEICAPLLQAPGEAPFSSSAARQALREGRPADAARILGDWHRIEGPVEHGDKRGRTLGFPTANQSLDDVLHPAYGIYAVMAEIRTGPHRGVYDGVASTGLRPTFNKTTANFETYIFDFDGDVYEETFSVALIAHLRPEARFDGVDALVAQMRTDKDDAKAALAAVRRAPPPWSR